jgi:glycosyltransferase involved in cell wall biosynthesis
MKVLCVVDHGGAPSIRLRLRDCLPHYSRLGIETTVVAVRRSSLSERLRALREAASHDVVLLFKTIGFRGFELHLLRRANPRILFDFDDAVMFREQKYRRRLRTEDFEKFVRTMRFCCAAVAGNDFLASFAEACAVTATVLPTPIDTTKYQLKAPVDRPGMTIGWLGLSDGLPYVRKIQSALRRLSQRFADLKLKIVSDKPLDLDGVKIENVPWRPETEQENLASFDIGIMPLWDSVWTRGKCGYKILQYMGVGTAVVASDIGANKQIVSHGENGFLARTEDDWVNSIAALLENAELRRNFGTRGRELVERKYSLEQFANAYAAVLRQLSELRP